MHSWHCREMNSGCWHWSYNTLATWCKDLTHWKRPWCWERLKAGGEGDDRGWDGWMSSLTQWKWVWASSRSWWWTGKPGVLQSVGTQRAEHDWWLNWTEFRLHFFAVVSTRSLDLADKWKGQIFRVLVNFLHFQVQSICYISNKK